MTCELRFKEAPSASFRSEECREKGMWEGSSHLDTDMAGRGVEGLAGTQLTMQPTCGCLKPTDGGLSLRPTEPESLRWYF